MTQTTAVQQSQPLRIDIACNRVYLTEWSAGQNRSRWDYDPPDHTLEDMIAAGDTYFRTVGYLLRSGDLVYVTDAAGKRATLIINIVDQVRGKVAWDLDATHTEKTVVNEGQAYTIRNRGRARFSILDRDGKVIIADMASRDEAERELANLTRKAA